MHPIIQQMQYLRCNDGWDSGLWVVILMNRRSQGGKEARPFQLTRGFSGGELMDLSLAHRVSSFLLRSPYTHRCIVCGLGSPRARDGLDVGGLRDFLGFSDGNIVHFIQLFLSSWGGAVAVKKDGSSFATQRLVLPLSVKAERENKSGGGLVMCRQLQSAAL